MLERGLYHPGESTWHKIDPRLKIGGLVTLGLLMTIVDWRGLLCLTGGLFVILCLCPLPLKAFQSVIKAGIVLGFFYTLIMGWHWEDGWIFWEGYWSREGILQGLIMSWRILLVFLLTRIFAAFTLPSEQGIGIAFFFTPFYRLTPKAADFALLITLTLRFIPLLLEEAALLYKARLAKGNLSVKWIGRIKELAALLLPLLRITLRRAEEVAENLVARGYVSGGYRALGTKEWEERDSWGAVVLILWCMGTLLIEQFWRS
ncbi:ABC-type cobalt transport system, permease component CbiQ [Desulfitobacterium dehalogenans ATCC 51507]|uniref:ABC-type cobalt transport system, permease component CbiQ n=1 Tax=Desulfitobacterium dehalogenans (strain ATCC 51507 / DSM 9161 / JW/IU-DC1) TaxID=756499 RepID=I4A5X1_DESDJ|nr:energy-coupling factor transporter transmembrane component T [Desulfitobacterium dehalogenans]AFL99355.1 ABC-type cobalt transport system, permease component CbiQ [Desulfitobacterium dehalogenans ATCC 51507]